MQKSSEQLCLNAGARDLEMPLPPLALAPLQHGIRSLQVAVEEPALRQALSNLIEGAMLRTNVGGKVEIVSTGAPADTDAFLTPFGADLFSEDMVGDNMTWNFVAGLAVAREILESLWLCSPCYLSPDHRCCPWSRWNSCRTLVSIFNGLSDLWPLKRCSRIGTVHGKRSFMEQKELIPS
ncbi:chloroplast sensor kinase [Quercus suber]|uniref:Chloroplast sensor kinase n=1 Tax=Quercus suber TaxID=58331 RepID=A0AAW0LL97_QUESU